ncbi:MULTISPECIES: ABC transporter permease [unclassified Rhizobium]|uniref:ABC transporter permease n=1 Tax=unclassified Rhizobium TaxID=2613769 RepID=UPI001615CAC6|nr:MULTISPECIES: ABC transporter permease [unclassified Rhizobium]MBB3320382.1 ABC-type dipeptide/oligopeptide/nickel transport system permease component [Rhizobium sp. BK181]MCS4096251.1 ABC-type dipeptide/oligopeptide/nickel transport system permease component [Rhizobium sp. BK176]
MNYLSHRLLRALLVLIGVSFATFMVAYSTGDPVALLIKPNATDEVRRAVTTHLGLDKPLIAQYGLFLWRALHGDLGQSFVYNQSVVSLVADRLSNTFLLAFASFFIALLLSVTLGVLAALYRNTWIDAAITLFTMIGLAVPAFWLGLMLIVIFAVHWQFFPVSGSESASSLVLPALTLSMQSTARLCRLVRSGMIEVLNADFIRTARAKGLYEKRVVWVHALRNALLPVVTMAGLELGDLISSAVVIEAIFAWPGIGRLAIGAVSSRDFPLLQGTVLVSAFCFVAINLFVDWLYHRIDPRVRNT